MSCQRWPLVAFRPLLALLLLLPVRYGPCLLPNLPAGRLLVVRRKLSPKVAAGLWHKWPLLWARALYLWWLLLRCGE